MFWGVSATFLLTVELKDPAGMYKHSKTVLLNASPPYPGELSVP